MGIATPASSCWIILQGKARKQLGANNPRLWYLMNSSSPRLFLNQILACLDLDSFISAAKKSVTKFYSLAAKVLCPCDLHSHERSTSCLNNHLRSAPIWSSSEHTFVHISVQMLAVSPLCRAAAVPWAPASPGPAPWLLSEPSQAQFSEVICSTALQQAGKAQSGHYWAVDSNTQSGNQAQGRTGACWSLAEQHWEL